MATCNIYIYINKGANSFGENCKKVILMFKNLISKKIVIFPINQLIHILSLDKLKLNYL